MDRSDYEYHREKGHGITYWTHEAQVADETLWFIYFETHKEWYVFRTTWCELGNIDDMREFLSD